MRTEHAPSAAEDERIRRLLSAGTQILGGSSASAVSAAIGLFVAGPAGAAVGGAAGAALSMAFNRLGNEITERLLSPREQARVGYVLAKAAQDIHDLIDQGEVLRTDGFFDSQTGSRSDAEEIAESVLLKSQREAEEKKLPYMAHLLANLAFTRQVNASMAHMIIKNAEQLSFRQLCILQVADENDLFHLKESDFRNERSFDFELSLVLCECMDLYNRVWIDFGDNSVLSPKQITPAKMRPVGLGQIAQQLMQLRLIPDQDLLDVVAELR